MSPQAQKAFEKWFPGFEKSDDWSTVSMYDCSCAFEAGWNAAIVQTEVSSKSQAGDAGSTPAGSTITADAIYAAYPRKVAKQDALKAIRNAMKATGGARLLAATKLYGAAMAKCPLEERKFIPHPATWFNRGSYEDDPAEWGNPEVSQFSVSH